LDVQLEESYYLSTLFVEYARSNRFNDVGFYNLDSSNIVAITSSSSPQPTHDLIQSLECNSTILERHRTSKGIEAFQLL